MNKSFIIIIIIFLRESVTYSFTCMYREVFLNIYFKGEITFACVYYCLRLSLFEYLKYIYQRNYSRKENIATICRPCNLQVCGFFCLFDFFFCFFFCFFGFFFVSLFLFPLFLAQIRTFFFSLLLSICFWNLKSWKQCGASTAVLAPKEFSVQHCENQ